MANKLTADEVVTQLHVRGHIQFGGPRPGNETKYYGKAGQYFFVGSLSAPEGDISPIRVPDPARRKAYRLVGRSIEPPDLASYTLTVHEKHGAVPRALGKIGCQFNMYLVVGRCKDPSSFDQGWDDYLHILSGGIVTDKDHGDRTSMDSDDAVASELSVTLADEYAVGPLGFGAEASAQATREVIDVAYAPPDDCTDCAEGTERIYAVTASSGAGSPGMPAEVIYSVDGGNTWSEMGITGLGAAVSPATIDVVSGYLLVLVPAEDAYYYSEINGDTGVPSSTWTKVTSGFVAAGSPNDVYVASASEIWLCGDGGYIYKVEDITSGATVINAGSATTSNLSRIDGVDDTIVAVGATGAIIKSTNRGATWATTTSNASIGVTIQALAVLDQRRFWIGTSAGAVWYTLTGGESWVEKTFSGLIAIQDIVFPTEECGYIAGTITGPEAKLYATCNGGATWSSSRARILGIGTHDRINRVAFPFADSQTAANNVALAGLAGDGTDGVLLLGAAATL